jgi:hypothetical protein
MERRFRSVHRGVSEEIRNLRRELQAEFGSTAWLAAHLGGPLLSWTARREDRRLNAGQTYEPPTFLERSNWAEEQA